MRTYLFDKFKTVENLLQYPSWILGFSLQRAKQNFVIINCYRVPEEPVLWW